MTIADRVITRLWSELARWFYPFKELGSHVSIHPTVDLSRRSARFMRIGSNVQLQRDVWLNVVVPAGGQSDEPALITLGSGTALTRRSIVSAKNRIELGNNVMIAPHVLLMDHAHEFSDVTRPIVFQGATEGGEIVIEDNCWVGYNASVIAARGVLTIGRNSVVGANAVVTRGCPPGSLLVGAPARIVKSFDEKRQEWIRTAS